MRSPQYQRGVCCPHCFDELTAERRARFTERQKQVELASRRGETHIGAPMQAVERGES